MSGFFKSSIGRKWAMALSALFLMFFLIIHLSVNILSVFSPGLFNEASHFMGTNPLVQFALQPVLIFGVIFHFVLGFILEIRNRNARKISYAKNDKSATSSWVSRNMIWSGAAILAFLVLHFYDFWAPEINIKYFKGDMSGLLNPANVDSGFRYYEELVHKFADPIRVAAYVIAFVFLALHLLHGFASAFQSMGASTIRKERLKLFANIYSIVLPLGFVFIALYHHFNH